MKAVRFSALLLAGTLPALGPIHYAPGLQHYRLHLTDRRVQEKDGQKSEGTITNDQLITIDIRGPHSSGEVGKNDTLRFAMSLDSISLNSTYSVSLPDVSAMQGTTVSGDMLPSGRVLNFKSDTKAQDGVDRSSMVESMAHFFPTLPDTAKMGSKWTDTTNANLSNNGTIMQTQTIATTSVVGDTTYDGQRAWRIQRQAIFKISGSQVQEKQQISMSGDGTGEGTFYIGFNGVYLASVWEKKMNLVVKSAGEVIPATTTSTSTVELAR
jgi:hypothetical protein